MDKKYWLGRKRAAVGMARKATSAEARLIHFELAGRYSVNAAYCDGPFLLGAASPEGERALLRPIRP
jgi:hypothetical protein